MHPTMHTPFTPEERASRVMPPAAQILATMMGARFAAALGPIALMLDPKVLAHAAQHGMRDAGLILAHAGLDGNLDLYDIMRRGAAVQTDDNGKPRFLVPMDDYRAQGFQDNPAILHVERDMQRNDVPKVDDAARFLESLGSGVREPERTLRPDPTGRDAFGPGLSILGNDDEDATFPDDARRKRGSVDA